MHLARHLVVSTLVLGSFGTLADAVFAEDEPAQISALISDEGNEIIAFECTLPVFGSVRCGSPNHNVRVPGRKAVAVVVTSSTSTNCALFTVHHAIENKDLTAPIEVCTLNPAAVLWTNN